VGKIKFKGKLTELENLHLTLKFLGEIDEGDVKLIRERLKGVKFNKMELKLGEIGTFSIRSNPRIVWVKILGESVWGLQRKIDLALSDLFKMEERFMSHLTIARIKYVNDKINFNERIKKIGVKEINFNISEFKLKKSDLKPLGPVYTDIEIYTA